MGPAALNFAARATEPDLAAKSFGFVETLGVGSWFGRPQQRAKVTPSCLVAVATGELMELLT